MLFASPTSPHATPSRNWTAAIAWANGTKFYMGMRQIPVTHRRARTVNPIAAALPATH